MKFILLLLLSLFCANVFAQTSYVAPTKILSKHAYQFGLSSDYFSSSKHIDEDGKKTSFKNGESFKRIQGEASGYYGLTGNLQIGGGLRYRQNSSTIFNGSTSKNETETSSGVQSTFVSLLYAFKPVGRLQYSLEGLVRYMPYTNEEITSTSAGSMILGDDGVEYSVGFGATYSSTTNNYLTVRGGYRSPGKNLSTEIYWQVEGALAWRYLALVAGVDGVSSMNNDPYKDDPGNRPEVTTGNTMLYHSVNRQWMAPYAGANIALGKNWRVELKGSQVVSGRSTDLGTSYGISLIRRVDDGKLVQTDQKFKDYDFEATITKISPKKGFVVIDKGLADDVQKGMKIDFFEFDYVGGNILLARGTVMQTKSDSSVVKITHIYNTKKEFKEGTVARGSFR
jgi:hypothetical protein